MVGLAGMGINSENSTGPNYFSIIGAKWEAHVCWLNGPCKVKCGPAKCGLELSYMHAGYTSNINVLSGHGLKIWANFVGAIWFQLHASHM